MKYWIITILAILMSILEIKYAYEFEKEDKVVKRMFIMMGLMMIFVRPYTF